MITDGLIQTILGGIVIEAIILLIVMFKTVPVIENQIKTIYSNQDKQDKINDGIRGSLSGITTTLAENRKDLVSIKHDFDEQKQLSKETYSDLKKTVENCTQAIIELKIIMKLLQERL